MQKLLLIICLFAGTCVSAGSINGPFPIFGEPGMFSSTEKSKFLATADLLDAAISSINSLNSLVKKESYRNKVAAFNNPVSFELGFNLEAEIQKAIKPILDKSKNINAGKFSSVISCLISNSAKYPMLNSSFPTSGIFSPVFNDLIWFYMIL